MNLFKTWGLRKTLAVIAIVALAIGATWYFRMSGPSVEWPQFAETENQEPSVVVQVDPDFGYRTGDLIPVTIFVQEKPGTEVDITSLALEGDFEIRGEIALSRGTMPGGEQGYRLQVNLQSFVIKPRLNASMSFTWNVKGERQWKELKRPLVDVFTSLTWDGERKEIQNGSTKYLSGNHMLVSIAWLVVPVLVFIGCIVFIRYYQLLNAASEEKLMASPRMICKRKIAAARKRIEEEGQSPAAFQEVAAAMREFQDVQTILLKHFPSALSDSPYRKRVQGSVNLAERVVYGNGITLNAAELKWLWEFIDDVLLRRNPEAEMDPDYILNRKRPKPKAAAPVAKKPV